VKLPKLESLKLNLSCNLLTDSSLTLLSPHLSLLKNLSKLSLSFGGSFAQHNNLSDLSFTRIIKHVRKLKRLRELKLDFGYN
jgi:hypothetical protein